MRCRSCDLHVVPGHAMPSSRIALSIQSFFVFRVKLALPSISPQMNSLQNSQTITIEEGMLSTQAHPQAKFSGRTTKGKLDDCSDQRAVNNHRTRAAARVPVTALRQRTQDASSSATPQDIIVSRNKKLCSDSVNLRTRGVERKSCDLQHWLHILHSVHDHFLQKTHCILVRQP